MTGLVICVKCLLGCQVAECGMGSYRAVVGEPSHERGADIGYFPDMRRNVVETFLSNDPLHTLDDGVVFGGVWPCHILDGRIGD